MKITFFGIKNDTKRSGFEIVLPKSNQHKIDPVSTLYDYVKRTEPQRQVNGPVFLTLREPFKALEASSIAKILESSIQLAGLSDQGFTAKSFRPTGATVAIEQNINPDIVRKVGRWKNSDVFYAHYVHSRTPSCFTDNILNFK